MSERATPADDDQLEREQRVRTLRDLAAVATPVERQDARAVVSRAEAGDDDDAPSGGAIPRAPLVTAADGFAALEDWSSPARRVFWLVTLVAVVLTLALYGALSSGALRFGGGAARVTGSASAAGTAAPTVIPLARDNIACVADMAWSLDSASVAALGYSTSGQCNGIGFLNVYNATTKRLTVQVTLDTVVMRALTAVNASSNPTPFINYQRVLWSGSGRLLAVTFTVYTFLDAPNTNVSLQYSGLVLMDNTGGHIRVLLQPYPAYNAIATRWDVTTGKATILPAPATTSGDNTYSSLAPALWYDWTPDSVLVPSIPLSAVTSPPSSPLTDPTAPIGSPVSDAQFSVWQPGVASLDVSSVNGGQTNLIPGAYTWNTAFATWSPDGRYIVDPVSLTARVQPSGVNAPSPSALRQMGLDAAPLLPVRDTGLSAVLANMPKNTYDPSSQRVLLTWNSDARKLATYPSSLYVPAGVYGQSVPVTIYDTASGGVVRTLTPPAQGSPTFLRVDGALRWSPDSRHLALYDPGLARLVIWDTSAFAD